MEPRDKDVRDHLEDFPDPDDPATRTERAPEWTSTLPPETAAAVTEVLNNNNYFNDIARGLLL
jgi:hypothetical protein